METKKNGYQTGVASEYLVLSMLYRLGIDAYMTVGNKKNVDIQVVKEDGSSLSIDVKSIRNYDSIPVGNVQGKDNHYVLFVIYNKKFEQILLVPDFYIVPSAIVVERRKKFAGNRVNILKRDIEKYKDRWDLICTSFKDKCKYSD